MTTKKTGFVHRKDSVLRVYLLQTLLLEGLHNFGVSIACTYYTILDAPNVPKVFKYPTVKKPEKIYSRDSIYADVPRPAAKIDLFHFFFFLKLQTE